jgi:hypothetical protein
MDLECKSGQNKNTTIRIRLSKLPKLVTNDFSVRPDPVSS